MYGNSITYLHAMSQKKTLPNGNNQQDIEIELRETEIALQIFESDLLF